MLARLQPRIEGASPGLIAAGLALGYLALYLLAAILIDDSIRLETRGSGCTELREEDAGAVGRARLVLGLLFAAWVWACGSALRLAGVHAFAGEDPHRRWRTLTKVIVIGTAATGFLAVLIHDGLAAFFVSVLGVVAGAIVVVVGGIGVASAARRTTRAGSAAWRRAGPLALVAGIVVFVTAAGGGLIGLYAGQLDPVTVTSTC